MGLLAARVRETTTTTGTGTLSLLGAVTGCQRFVDAFGVGNPCYYVVQAVDASGVPTGDWEQGRGTVGAGTLTRDRVIASGNAGALVSFAAGTKDVYCDAPAEAIDTYVHDQASAAATWTIPHGLGKFPSVTVVDSTGRVVIGGVSYTDRDTVEVSFRAAFAGTAYLN